MMRCPRCALRLQKVNYQSVNVHCCSECSGILVGRDRLSRLAVTSRKTIVELIQDWEQRQLLPAVERPRCPECRIVMDAAASVGRGRFMFAECRKCQLLWMDPGDLEVWLIACLVQDFHRQADQVQIQQFDTLLAGMQVDRQSLLIAKIPRLEE